MTTHPCGAVGISTVQVVVPQSRDDNFAELYGHILGVSPRVVEEHGKSKRLVFEVGKPVHQYGSSIISLCSEQGPMDQNWLRDGGHGIRGIILSVAGRKGHGEEALGTEGTPSTVSLKW